MQYIESLIAKIKGIVLFSFIKKEYNHRPLNCKYANLFHPIIYSIHSTVDPTLNYVMILFFGNIGVPFTPLLFSPMHRFEFSIQCCHKLIIKIFWSQSNSEGTYRKTTKLGTLNLNWKPKTNHNNGLYNKLF